MGSNIVVATVNLRCLVDDWDVRRGLLVNQIADVDPDLLAVQEVCESPDPERRNNLDELLSGLSAATGRTYSARQAPTHVSWDLYTEGVAIVSAHGFEEERTIDLSAGVFPRRLVAGHVSIDGTSLIWSSTHLSFGPEQASTRQVQMTEALAALSREFGDKDPTFLVGDFNEDPRGAALAIPFSEGYHDVWSELNPGAPGPTFPSVSPAERIDYIWLRSGLATEVAQVIRFLGDPVDNIWPSDHLGVAAWVWIAVE